MPDISMSDSVSDFYLFDSQPIDLTAVRLDFEVGMLLYDRFQSADQRVERIAGIGLLGPQGLADLRL